MMKTKKIDWNIVILSVLIGILVAVGAIACGAIQLFMFIF